jgi:endonuclease/exonuclease/phosphatase (EEP) superfamily protein YafD
MYESERFVRLTISVDDSQEITAYGIHGMIPITPSLFAFRNKNFSDLANDIMKYSERPIIVSGDFNMTPWSLYYQHLIEKTSLRPVSTGSPKLTWSAYQIPLLSLDIDHTLTSEAITLHQYELIQNTGSDHKAQFFRVSVAK